ncbi:hypothetical protein NEFER01_2185 [Nematocida sp. LUAm1]|nr:hypothetical protein NEFER02_0913 [Nematocida sp. LUAm2]KAI5179343.1 hypothetical protein NEFER01_2185 [Nematocida sp. LUAm1]
MEIILRREKRQRACIVECMWRMLVVYVALLSMAYGTERVVDANGRANSLQNQGYNGKEQKDTHDSANNIEQEKKKIAKNLLRVFHIDRPLGRRDNSIDMHNIEYFCKKITYQESRYYVDLSDFHIWTTNSREVVCYSELVEKTLKQIGYIRCGGLIFGRNMNTYFQLVKILMDQIIVEDSLYLYSVYVNWSSPNAPMSVDVIDCIGKLPEKLKEDWKVRSPIALFIGKCCQKLTEYFLNYMKNRKIKEINIEDLESGLEVFDLGKNRITEECPIILNGLPDTKRVVLPQAKNNTYAYIKLLGIPMLQGINTKGTSSSNIVVKDLGLDGQTLISLVKAYMMSLQNDDTESEGSKPARQVLEVENLHLYEMPYAFIKTEDISFPWMKVKNVTIYIEHCDGCDISVKDVVPQKCTKATLAKVGIQCKNSSVYESLTDSDMLKDKAVCSQKFIEEISCTSIHLNCFKCPNNSDAKVYSAPCFLNIDLNNSEKIQKAIGDFQKKHNMISIHIKHPTLKIRGSKSPKNDISLIESIFKCLGARIRADIICFYDIKEFVELNMLTQGQDLSFIIPPKSTFIMNAFQFYNSDIGFIGDMLNSYHIPDIGIYIDGKEKNKKDIKALKLEAMNKKAANIAIKEEERRKRKQTPDEPKKSPTKRSLIE